MLSGPISIPIFGNKLNLSFGRGNEVAPMPGLSFDMSLQAMALIIILDEDKKHDESSDAGTIANSAPSKM